MKASQRPRNTTQLEDDDDELRALADLPDETQQTLLIPSKQEALVADVFDDSAFDSFFGLIPAEDLVVVRPYSGDDDELILQEIRPRFIVMYDPDPAFIRRVEVCHTEQTAHKFFSSLRLSARRYIEVVTRVSVFECTL